MSLQPTREQQAEARHLPVGDRAWPVMSLLCGLLFGAPVTEYLATRLKPPARIVDIGGSAPATDGDGEDDDGAVLADGPERNESHARARALARRGEYEEALKLFVQVVSSAPDDATLHSEYGYWLMAGGQPDAARTELDLAVKLQPRDARIAFKRGLVLARLGDAPGAAREYQRAIELLPSFDRARIALGRAHLYRGDFARAAKVLRPATERGDNRGRAQALVAYGRAQLGLSRFSEAEKSFESAIERAPALAELRVAIGRAWLKSPRHEDVERAIAVMSSALQLAPDSPLAHSGLGQALERADDDGAERSYEEALRLDPDYVFVRKRLLHRALDRDDTKRALYHAERLIRQDTERAEHHFLLGLVTARGGDVARARTHYQEAIKKSHDGYPESWLNLGKLEAEAGNRDAALAAYRRALELRPNYAAALNNLGLVLEDVPDLAAAEKAFRDAMRADPGAASARVNLGTFLSRRGRYPEAIHELEAAVRLRGNDYPLAELKLAVAYLRKGDAPHAAKLCRSLVARRPRSVGAWHDLGLALGQMGDTGGALTAFRTALSVNPEHKASLRKLAELETAAGTFGDAKRHYQELLDLDAKDTTARVALAELHRRSGDRAACERELRAAQPSIPATTSSINPTELCASPSALNVPL